MEQGFIKNFWHYRFLLKELVVKGIRLKYRRSYLGILWSLLEPILTTIVLTVVFGTLFHKSSDSGYPLYILTGRLVFSFFSTGTTAALKSIRANQSMIQKVYVPKYMYPLSSVLFNYIIFLISLLVLIGTMVVLRVRPTLYLLTIVAPLLVLFLLTIGVGMILATIGVYFRDMEYLWNVVTMLIMYLSAIFYDPDAILASNYGFILKYNPVYGVIATCRDAVFGRPMDFGMLGYAAAFSLVCLLIGSVLFEKKQDQFILHL